MQGSVTALIPTYNRAEYLAAAIESVLQQGPVVGQIIICDDGSTDNTASVIQKFGDRVTYFHQANAGKSCALNAVIERVKTAYTWVVDDDDIALPGAATQLAAALEANRAAGLAFGKYIIFQDTPDGRIETPMEDRSHGKCDTFISNLALHRVLHEACLFRTEAMVQTGPFDPRLYRSQDWDYTLRLTARYPAVHVPAFIFMHRDHTGWRGPSMDRFAAAERRKKWANYDKLIISKALTEIPLERFSLAPDADRDRRLLSAHLVRATTCYRRALWDEGLTELEQFVALANASDTLTFLPEETALVFEHFLKRSSILVSGSPKGALFEPLRGMTDPAALAAIRKPIVAALTKKFLRSLRKFDGVNAKASSALLFAAWKLRASRG